MNRYLFLFWFLLLPAILPAQLQSESMDSLDLDYISKAKNSKPGLGLHSWQIDQGSISNLPIRGIENILSLNPEYVVQDGRAHLRGSRDDEIGYFLEGMNIRNPMTGQMYDLLIEEATEAMQINAGYFGVNYGNSVAGIVTQQMRSGGDRFSFDLHYRAEPARAGDDLGGSYASGYANTVLTAGGPLFSDNLRFFIAQEISHLQDHNPRFYSSFSYFNQPAKTGYSSSFPTEYVDVIWPGTIAPKNGLERYKTNINLQYQIKDLNIDLSSALRFEDKHINFSPISQIFNERGAFNRSSNIFLNGSFAYRLFDGGKIFASVGYSLYDNETHDDKYGSEFMQWYDPPPDGLYYREYEINGFAFAKPGTPPMNTYAKDQNETFSSTVSFELKLYKENDIKIGADFTSYTLSHYSLSTLGAYYARDYFMVDPLAFARSARVNNYGFDEYGNSLDSGFMGPKKPKSGGLYIEDNFQSGDLQVNLGLRFDYLDGDDHRFKDPQNPLLVNGELVPLFVNGELVPESFEKIEPHTTTNPRLSVNFIAGEKTELFTRYGSYTQLSRGLDRYEGSYALSRRLRGGFAFLEPIGLELRPVQSQNFEIGIKHRLTNELFAKLLVFSRSVTEQGGPERVITKEEAPIQDYNTQNNRIWGETRGVFVNLNWAQSRPVSGQFSYSYTVAKGLTSGPFEGTSTLEQASEFPATPTQLNYTPLHRATFVLDYRHSDDENRYLDGFGFGFIYRFDSGHPYTLSGGSYGGASFEVVTVVFESDTRARKPVDFLNSSEINSSHLMDLRIDKTFKIGEHLGLKLYFDVTNLFNWKNEVNVYLRTGNSSTDGYDLFQKRGKYNIRELGIFYYGPMFDAFYRDINLANANAYYKVVGKEMWNEPRQIRFGIIFQY